MTLVQYKDSYIIVPDQECRAHHNGSDKELTTKLSAKGIKLTQYLEEESKKQMHAEVAIPQEVMAEMRELWKGTQQWMEAQEFSYGKHEKPMFKDDEPYVVDKFRAAQLAKAMFQQFLTDLVFVDSLLLSTANFKEPDLWLPKCMAYAETFTKALSVVFNMRSNFQRDCIDQYILRPFKMSFKGDPVMEWKPGFKGSWYGKPVKEMTSYADNTNRAVVTMKLFCFQIKKFHMMTKGCIFIDHLLEHFSNFRAHSGDVESVLDKIPNLGRYDEVWGKDSIAEYILEGVVRQYRASTRDYAWHMLPSSISIPDERGFHFYLDMKWRCYTEGCDCRYSHTCIDPCGRQAYPPIKEYENIISYGQRCGVKGKSGSWILAYLLWSLMASGVSARRCERRGEEVICFDDNDTGSNWWMWVLILIFTGFFVAVMSSVWKRHYKRVTMIDIGAMGSDEELPETTRMNDAWKKSSNIKKLLVMAGLVSLTNAQLLSVSEPAYGFTRFVNSHCRVADTMEFDLNVILDSAGISLCEPSIKKSIIQDWHFRQDNLGNFVSDEWNTLDLMIPNTTHITNPQPEWNAYGYYCSDVAHLNNYHLFQGYNDPCFQKCILGNSSFTQGCYEPANGTYCAEFLNNTGLNCLTSVPTAADCACYKHTVKMEKGYQTDTSANLQGYDVRSSNTNVTARITLIDYQVDAVPPPKSEIDVVTVNIDFLLPYVSITANQEETYTVAISKGKLHAEIVTFTGTYQLIPIPDYWGDTSGYVTVVVQVGNIIVKKASKWVTATHSCNAPVDCYLCKEWFYFLLCVGISTIFTILMVCGLCCSLWCLWSAKFRAKMSDFFGCVFYLFTSCFWWVVNIPQSRLGTRTTRSMMNGWKIIKEQMSKDKEMSAVTRMTLPHLLSRVPYFKTPLIIARDTDSTVLKELMHYSHADPEGIQLLDSAFVPIRVLDSDDIIVLHKLLTTVGYPIKMNNQIAWQAAAVTALKDVQAISVLLDNMAEQGMIPKSADDEINMTRELERNKNRNDANILAVGGKSPVLSILLMLLFVLGALACTNYGSTITVQDTQCYKTKSGQKCTIAMSALGSVPIGATQCFDVVKSGVPIGVFSVEYSGLYALSSLNTLYHYSKIAPVLEQEGICRYDWFWKENKAYKECYKFNGESIDGHGALKSKKDVLTFPGITRCDKLPDGPLCSGTGEALYSRVAAVPREQIYRVGIPSGFIYHPIVTFKFITTGSRFEMNSTTVSFPLTMNNITMTINGIDATVPPALPEGQKIVIDTYLNKVAVADATDQGEVTGNGFGSVQSSTYEGLRHPSPTSFRYSPDVIGSPVLDATSISYRYVSQSEIFRADLPGYVDMNYWTYDINSNKIKVKMINPGNLNYAFRTPSFTFYRQITQVCPDGLEFISADGCYNCDTGSEVKVKLRSSCTAGDAMVSILDDDNITLATQYIQLSTESEEHVISFTTTAALNNFNLKISANGGSQTVNVWFVAVSGENVGNTNGTTINTGVTVKDPKGHLSFKEFLRAIGHLFSWRVWWQSMLFYIGLAIAAIFGIILSLTVLKTVRQVSKID